MNRFMVLLLAGVAALTLAGLRVGLAASTAMLGVSLATLQALGAPVWGVVWGLWAALALFAVPALRRKVLMAPALAAFRRRLPPMSATEREALEAGSVWWDAELFSGRPDWARLRATPKPALSAEERAFLDGPVEALCTMVDDWHITYERRDLPPEVWSFIREQGFLGMIIPKRYGGLGFSAQAHSAVVSKLASRSVSVAVTVMVPNSLGPAELLLHYGTDAQKDHYLPRLAKGTDIPCFALTSPEAGSDAASIPDRGVVCWGEHQGKRTLGIRVTWEKRYITLGPVATVLGLAFQLSDPEGLLGEASDEVGITLALIPTDHPGVHIGRRHFPGNQAFMNGPNWGRDVFIPMDWVIGGQAYCGRGWMMLMNCLAAGRAISLPAMGTTSAKYCARVAGAYARVRKQFKLPVGKMEGVEEALARIGGHAYALEAARRLTTVGLDLGERPAVISAIMKYQATERMRAALNDAMDIHGGKGICAGPSNYLANAYQAIPVGITVEGANILTRSLIVFGQGALRCHPWLLQEIEAAASADTAQALAAFDRALTGHLGHVLGNLARAFGHGFTGAAFAPSPEVEGVRHWYRELYRLSSGFALVADVALLVLGGELKRREKLSGRFADCLAELYLASSVLKRWEDEGRPAEDRAFVDYCCASSLYTIERQLDGILANFPVVLVGGLLRRIVFPWGRRMHGASDEQGHAVAALMLEPSAARDRLTAGIFVSRDPADVTGALEHALELTIAADAVDARLRAAVRAGRLERAEAEAALAAGVIDAAEAELLERAAAAVRAVIMVDDFSNEELSGGQVLTVRPPRAESAATLRLRIEAAAR